MERLADSLAPALLALLVALGLLAVAAAAVWLVLSRRARRLPPATGRESLIGVTGRTRTSLDPGGAVFLEGELWRARTGGARVPADTRVRVVAVEGTTLVVEPVKGSDPDARPVGGHHPSRASNRVEPTDAR